MPNKPLKSQNNLGPDLRIGEQFRRRILESAVAAACVIDLDGRFVEISQRAVEITGYSLSEMLGKNCGFLVAPEDKSRVEGVVESALRQGQSFSKVEIRFICKDGTVKDVTCDIGPIWLDDRVAGAVATAEDVTDARRAEEALRQRETELRMLSSRLLDLQDSERRRIARELHDGTAQNLFALNIALSRLLQLETTEESRETLQECVTLCEQSREEIRTLSYVLHPPMLDEAGLVSALRWYTDGFSARSGIRIELEAAHNIRRLPPDLEMDLFRVVQECLTNIHRHSGSSRARVRLDTDAEWVRLEVRDWGRGIPAEIASGRALASRGVGIPGMRERVGHHNGRLDIQSSDGTIITATLPLAAPKRPEGEEAPSNQESGYSRSGARQTPGPGSKNT
jgi:PAS domain S-box-containing protein